MLKSLKKLIVLTYILTLLFLPKALAAQSAPYAIIGGQENVVGGDGPSYAAIVSLEGADQYVATKLTGAVSQGNGFINSVAINSFGSGIIGGDETRTGGFGTGNPYTVIVSPSGVARRLTGQIPNPALTGTIFSVAINSSGASIIGGQDNTTRLYQALVSPAGVATRLTGGANLPIGTGLINSVAINDSGSGIIGGQENTNRAYQALVSQEGVARRLTGGVNLPTGNGFINSVAINSSGVGIIGGQENNTRPYQALVSREGVARRLTGQIPNSAANGFINSVAINSSGAAIIGGQENTNRPYQALVSPEGVARRLTGQLPQGNGGVSSVAINDSGSAIIGGDETRTGGFLTGSPYAAIVSPRGIATRLTGQLAQGIGLIRSVAIRSIDPASFGAGNTSFDSLLALSTEVLNKNLNNAQSPSPNSDPQGVQMAALVADSESANINARVNKIMGEVFSQMTSEKSIDKKNEEPVAFWISPFGIYSRYNQTGPFPKLRNNGVGALLGFDYLGAQDMIFGAGFAYAYQGVSFSGSSNHTRSNQEFLTLYWAGYFKRVSVQSSVWGGVYQTKNRRDTLGVVTSRANIYGWLFCPHARVGYPIVVQSKRWANKKKKSRKQPNRGTILEPFVMLDWASNWQGKVKETGDAGFNLRINRKYVCILRSEVGLSAGHSFQYTKCKLGLDGSLSYVNEVPFNGGDTSAFYEGSISTFTLQMFNNKIQNLGAARVGVKYVSNNLKAPSLALNYQGELGSNLFANAYSLEIKWKF